jgi:RNA polymerase sigma-70 factor (ECF subfamily)
MSLLWRKGSEESPKEPVRAFEDDPELVLGVARGDRAALDALFEQYQSTVARYFGRLLGPRADLEDLVQATFLEALKSARRFRRQSSVRAWLLGIATNVFRHHVRSESRKRTALRLLAELPDMGTVRPDVQAEHRETLERIEAALLELPESLRLTFILCELEDLPRIEAAKIMGVRFGSIARRIFDARQALRAAVDGETS